MADATIPLAAGGRGRRAEHRRRGDGSDPPAGLGDTSAFAVPPPATPVRSHEVASTRARSDRVRRAARVGGHRLPGRRDRSRPAWPAALLILGMGFVLGAFVGGSRVLILPALLVGAALAVTAVIDIPLDGPVGPAALGAHDPSRELDDRYEVSLGEGTLDLRGVDIPAGERDGRSRSASASATSSCSCPTGMAVEVTHRGRRRRVRRLRASGRAVSTSTTEPDASPVTRPAAPSSSTSRSASARSRSADALDTRPDRRRADRPPGSTPSTADPPHRSRRSSQHHASRRQARTARATRSVPKAVRMAR